ncbi:glycosyltransferase [Paenibacillus sp. F411]|uniref:glycosyltransferase family 2 protein n=1 Tax=Paenibacillus sp. F411 TaxID=2820239 RepID=UPI001AAEE9AD|nr:glycosyltransferase [Paenibacillus sp. F411]
MFISVVMAVYNGEAYLEEAVHSVLGQTYPHFELIVVNDGSSDRTADILSSIQDPRLRVISVEVNQGAARCLNLGIANAAGDWIAIHDADDLSDRNRLAEQAAYLQAHPGCIGVGSLIMGRMGDEAVITPEIESYNIIRDPQDIYATRHFTCYLCHGSVTFSKQAFYAAGQYNPNYRISYDYDLWLRMFEISPIEKVPKVLYHYRLRDDSLGKTNMTETIKELMTISSHSISRQQSTSRKQAPLLTIIGSRKGCLFYKRHVAGAFPRIRFVIVHTPRDYRKLQVLRRRGQLRTAVLLNNPLNQEWYPRLQSRSRRSCAMFKIWNDTY